MFKISEAAHKLNVETFVIFEKLLTHAELMKDHTQKIHSVSYIDEQGIDILQALIEGKPIENIGEAEVVDEEISSGDESADSIVEIEDENHTSEMSTSDDEDWLTEDDLTILDNEKQKLRGEISRLRQELIQYDTELKKMDEVIDNYQILLKEDVARLTLLESHMESILLQSTIKDESKQKDESTGMFGFIRK